ncbi:gliding motility protein GldN [Flavobacterium agricola]|uniref:Gliding motility protein GldN n=1 Tax=Flavobacterium agricola TaxID=2870839 RepID=A0ABY6LZK6_9FLAO|nr:gliding motility protein GldN [Flavobacterium agricola]UYW00595.1 gliding motility protein GldN [Flavobacterium agricola]
MQKRFLLLFSSIIFSSTATFAQSNLLNAKIPEEIGEKTAAQLEADNDKPLPYPWINDRDVLYGKRVWEIIDLDERINFPFYFPIEDNLGSGRKPLFSVLLDGIKDGEVTEVFSDSYFQSRKTLEEILSSFTFSELTNEGNEIVNMYNGRSEEELKAQGILEEWHFVNSEVTPADVVQYKLVGYWFFDAMQAEMKFRVLGIAPVAVDALSKARGMEDATTELFWVFYPSVRDLLHEHYAFNNRNSSVPFSFDNLFTGRRFGSVIYKEENVYGDRAIDEYIIENAQMQLLESQRIKEKIRDIEQDMWTY